jgi:hypothetical protein
MTYEVGTVVSVYLVVGFLIGFALLGWIAVSSVRRHGFRTAVRGGARAYVEELWLLYLALLRWHYRAKARGRGTPHRRTVE